MVTVYRVDLDTFVGPTDEVPATVQYPVVTHVLTARTSGMTSSQIDDKYRLAIHLRRPEKTTDPWVYEPWYTIERWNPAAPARYEQWWIDTAHRTHDEALARLERIKHRLETRL